MESLSGVFHQNGLWFGSVSLILVFALAIVIGRSFALFTWRKPTQKLIAYDFEQDIIHGQMNDVIDRALHLGERNPLGGIVAAGAQAAVNLGGSEEIRARMHEILLHEKLKFEKYIHFLPAAAKTAFLVGLLGTIVSLIQSFRLYSNGIRNLNSSTIDLLIAYSAALGTALEVAAFGLMVSIFCIAGHAILRNRASQLSKDLDQAALKVGNWLCYSYRAIPPQKIKMGLSLREL